jgi:casein kinase 1
MEARQIRVGNRYILKKRIGGGSFGEIYRGTDSQTNEDIAIKLEKTDCTHPQLLGEAKILKYLKCSKGITKVHWFGTEGLFNIMIIDLLGPSLEDCFVECRRQFTLKTTLQLAAQMVARIEHVHQKDYLHRDIKPDNFLTGAEDEPAVIYLIDFGLSKRYRDVKTKQHIPYKEGRTLTGTARYASVGSHMGIEQGRKDDIEAIAYVLLYFLLGELPWQGIHVVSKQEKYHRICDMKMNLNNSVMKGHPAEFLQMLNYAKSLKFEEKPDYEYIQNLFKQVAQREQIAFDGVFDWTEEQVSPQPPPTLKAEAEPEIVKKPHKKKAKTPSDSRDLLSSQAPEVSMESREPECSSVKSEETKVVKGRYPCLNDQVRQALRQTIPQVEKPRNETKRSDRKSCGVF